MLHKLLARSGRFSIWSLITAMTLGLLAACGGNDDDGVPPAAPEQISVVAGDAQVTVAWGAVTGASSYNLYWSNTDGVTKANGTKIANVTSPYDHTGLTNGTTYYYVVTAVGDGGESAESPQVAATPQVPPPGAPTGVTATLTPETTKSVTITWNDVVDATSYNVYRGLSADIATNLAAATKFEGVVSPYVDVVPAGQVTYYYVVTAVGAGGESDPSLVVSATPRGSPSGGDTGLFGNNLSEPLVFADGIGVTGLVITGTDHTDPATGLRPTADQVVPVFPYFNEDDQTLVDGVIYYPQRTSSTWQASWVNAKGAGVQSVTVDWGDNLRSATLSADKSVIRVETNLLQDKGSASWADTVSMTGYPMVVLGGQGMNESQGTTGVSQDATRRRVFAVNARLMIQKLDAGDVPILDHPCNFTGQIAEGFGLEDSSQLKYGSEINVAGSLTYGYNWRLGSCPGDKAGKYRITFSLDPEATVGGIVYPNNVSLDALDAADTTAVLDSTTSSHIDVTVN